MSINALVANMQLLPTDVLAPNKPERIRNLVNYLKAASPEVVFLQEIWPTYYVDYIRAAVGPDYQVLVPETRFLGKLSMPGMHHTGLMMLVRMDVSPRVVSSQLSSRQFRLFEVSLPDEFLARKGVMLLPMEWEGKQVVLANTHLHASHYNKVDRTLKQFEELIRMLRHLQVDEVLLGGDLNLTPDQIRGAMDVMGIEYAISDNQDPNIRPDNPYQKKGVSGVPVFAPWQILQKGRSDELRAMPHPECRILNIVSFGPKNGININSTVLDEPQQTWSDHYGVSFKLTNNVES